MANDRKIGTKVPEMFAANSAGGMFVYSAARGHKLLYADQGVINLFECRDYEEFTHHVGGSFDGIVDRMQADSVSNEIEVQYREANVNFGYVFYNIKTISGSLKRMVNHWTYVPEGDEGLIYAYIFPHKSDETGSELDHVTGLYGKGALKKHVSKIKRSLQGRDSDEYAIIYLNLVNFKLLNIERGVSEGDACLQMAADILKKTYDDAFISRIADDHFAVFAGYEGLKEKTENARRQFAESYGNEYDVTGKFGIYRLKTNKDFNVEFALSQAKMACDYIKYDDNNDVVEFTDELAENIKTREYVAKKIDEAVKKEWIQVYFQPVIRSITGQLCGVESLVRWIDPVHGFLNPAQFISALEENRSIYKLDSYVVERVCRYMRERVENGEPVVPVSVNFSRLDFFLCDMLKIVEDAVEKYDIPRDYLHIEVTESILSSDEERMRNIILDFQNAGYEIWMDDFGSGYSSLTLLKDFRFDTLKLDMNFLTPFTDRARNIVRSTVTMAKDIGMKTVAEGVETQEHLDFLKSIGCEMIQGYYYGKPEPVDKMFESLTEKNIGIETRKERYFYEVAGFHVRASDSPLHIIEDDGKTFKTLFMNSKFRQQVPIEEDLDLESVDWRIFNIGTPQLHKYREFAKQIEKTGKEEAFYYTVNGKYFCLKARPLVKNGDRYILKAELMQISSEQTDSALAMLDSRLRDLNLLFEDVLLVNLQANIITPLLGDFRYLEAGPDELIDRGAGVDEFIKKKIYPDDAEACRFFFDPTTLYERVRNSGRGYIEEVVRVRQADGSYKWMEMYIMLVSNTGGSEFLYCMKKFTERNIDKLEKRDGDSRDIFKSASGGALFKNMMISDVKFFWKDREGRFMGVSRAFLEYFGLKDESTVIGKTNEELKWHMEEEPHIKKEAEVLNNGLVLKNVQSQTVVRGVVHNIVYNKIPIYEDVDIVGIIGWFHDRDEELRRFKDIYARSMIDDVTGLMNAHAFMDSMIDYSEQYYENERNFGLILLNNKWHKRVTATYDEEMADELLRKMADNIRELIGEKGIAARMKGSVFALLILTSSEGQLNEAAERIRGSLNGINEINGKKVTLRIKLSAMLRSNESQTDEAIYEKLLKQVEA